MHEFSGSLLEASAPRKIETGNGPGLALDCACPCCQLRQTVLTTEDEFRRGFAVRCQNGEKCGNGDTLLCFPGPGIPGYVKHNLKKSPDDPAPFIPTSEDPPF